MKKGLFVLALAGAFFFAACGDDSSSGASKGESKACLYTAGDLQFCAYYEAENLSGTDCGRFPEGSEVKECPSGSLGHCAIDNQSVQQSKVALTLYYYQEDGAFVCSVVDETDEVE